MNEQERQEALERIHGLLVQAKGELLVLWEDIDLRLGVRHSDKLMWQRVRVGGAMDHVVKARKELEKERSR